MPRHDSRSVGAWIALVLLSGCGWRLGTPTAALGVESVRGAAVEPGLVAAVDDGLARALRRRGVHPATPDLRVEVAFSGDSAAGAATGGAGAVLWTATLHLRAERLQRSGCVAAASGRRSWTVPPGEPRDASTARAAAHRELADDVADRLIDAVLARPECR